MVIRNVAVLFRLENPTSFTALGWEPISIDVDYGGLLVNTTIKETGVYDKYKDEAVNIITNYKVLEQDYNLKLNRERIGVEYTYKFHSASGGAPLGTIECQDIPKDRELGYVDLGDAGKGRKKVLVILRRRHHGQLIPEKSIVVVT
jgi:hypothetical protein